MGWKADVEIGTDGADGCTLRLKAKRKKDRFMNAFNVAAVCFFLASCAAEQPRETLLRDEMHHVNLVVEHLVGPALSQEQDTVSVDRNGRREVIFQGYGGSTVTVRPLKKGVLVLVYCGGAIQAASSFLVTDQSSGEAIAVKVQPVVASGVQIGGKDVCGEAAISTL